MIIVTDSLSVCTALSSPSVTPLRRSLSMLIPAHVKEVRLVWVPGHTGIQLNEVADYLAGVALNGPVVDVVPPIAHVISTRFRRYQALVNFPPDGTIGCPDLEHLRHSWKCDFAQSRLCEVTLTSFRCRTPNLNYYLHRAHIAPSALCSFCNEDESLEHFLLSCRRFSSLRKRYLEAPLRHLGLSLTVPNLLSFGALGLGFCHGDVCRGLHCFIAESGRLQC